MGDKTITDVSFTGDESRGTVTVITKDEERGTDRVGTCEYGPGCCDLSKAGAIEKATQDSINKH
jgi:hypothetical protein